MENHHLAALFEASLTLVKKFSGQKERLPAAMATVFDEKWESEHQYCSICLNDIIGGDGYRKLGECGHGFHSRCIDVWLHSHATCPLCRAQLPQFISLNEKNQYYEWNDFLSIFLVVMKDFVQRVCNPPLNDELSSMLCGGAISLEGFN